GPGPVDRRRALRGRCRARRVRGADPRDLRARGQSVLRYGSPLGRWRDRPARHPTRTDPRHRGRAPCPDPGHPVRGLPDVSRFGTRISLDDGAELDGLSSLPDDIRLIQFRRGLSDARYRHLAALLEARPDVGLRAYASP